MKHMIIAAVLASALSLQASATCTHCGDCGDKTADFFIKNNDTVVFLGDSITEQKLYTTYIEAYTLTRFPAYQLTFRNSGWGGDTAWLRQRSRTDEKKLFSATDELLEQMVAEAVNTGLSRDVLPLNPTVVTVNFGMNDHSYQGFRPDIFRAYKRSQEEIVRTLKKNGVRVALLTPQPIEDMKKDPLKDPRNISLRKFSDGLKDVAATEGAVYVDQFAPYIEIISKRKEDQQKTIGEGDAIHPGPCGHTVMAWAVLKGLGAPALVSSAVIDTSVKWFNFLKKKVDTKNCTVSNVSYSKGVLCFDRLDNALPMPIDKRAVNALKLAKITCTLNRYPLCIKGLPDGEYEVLIDDKPVTTLTSKEGQACTNLAKVATPASEQADKILALVFKKNEIYFNRWRNVQMKNGDVAKLAELDKKLVDMEQEINTLRKPVPHHFEVKRVQ